MVLSQNATVVATVQVKTRTWSADQGWFMSQKHERLVGEGLFYAFVDLETDAVLTYLLPSAVVAEAVRQTHRDWLSTPGKKGQKRNDTTMRRIRPSYPDSPKYQIGWLDEWRERWDLIEKYKPKGA